MYKHDRDFSDIRGAESRLDCKNHVENGKFYISFVNALEYK